MTRTDVRLLLSASVLCLLLSSCKKEQLATIYNNQETRIEKYLNEQITRNKAEHEKDPSIALFELTRNNGSNRLITKKGSGAGLSEGGTLTFHYGGFEFVSGFSYEKMFETNDSTIAKAAGWKVPKEQCEARTVKLDRKNLIEGLYNGLQGVQAGEVCQIVFSGKYGFGNKKVGIVPANAALIYYITVKEISN